MFLFFYNSIIFYYELYFLLFFIMNSAPAHMNSTSILLFSMNSTRAHMNSAAGPHVGPRLTAALQILEL